MLNSKQPLILSLETSTRSGGVALLRGNEVLAERAGKENSSQSAQLLSDIREILQKNDLNLNQINLFAVAVGPGSFTGLRIGLATAKALAMALKTPIAGISTLEAAASCSEKDGEICVVLPAGRNEYFAQSFKKSGQNDLKRASEIEIYTVKNLIEMCAEKNNSNWISTGEIISVISEAGKNTNHNYQALPQNLAISVGRTGHEIFLRGDLNEYPPNPVYARGAGIGESKNAK
ncbi:MAG TPA: tRNA (adenosine(37)-N6)-threonylcarbamoyltransferase complex dimerization subunit type 1 TsaB [Pyrinomonadaceae bacterium]|jgi:tRNA threonylcarbamoyl adenosine modification protein YeaZ